MEKCSATLHYYLKIIIMSRNIKSILFLSCFDECSSKSDKVPASNQMFLIFSVINRLFVYTIPYSVHYYDLLYYYIARFLRIIPFQGFCCVLLPWPHSFGMYNFIVEIKAHNSLIQITKFVHINPDLQNLYCQLSKRSHF